MVKTWCASAAKKKKVFPDKGLPPAPDHAKAVSLRSPPVPPSSPSDRLTSARTPSSRAAAISSGLPAFIYRPVVAAGPSWQAIANAAFFWWSGKPLCGVVVGLKDRFSFSLKLFPALLRLRKVFSLMLAGHAGVISHGGATAGLRGHGIECVSLI